MYLSGGIYFLFIFIIIFLADTIQFILAWDHALSLLSL